MEWNEPARLGYSDCAAMIKIKRVMKPDSPNLLLEVANHLVFPQDENRGAEFVQQLIETLKTSPESVNFVVAMDGEELVGFLVAVNTSEDCVLLSQAWSKPGNSWKIIDELFLRIILWTFGLGKSSIRAETSRDSEAVWRRWEFQDRSRIIERKLDPSLLGQFLDKAREVM